MALPSARSTWPSMDTSRPPMVNPEYIATPSDRSNAAHGPLSCAATYSGCLWKSGSSPRAAFSLYRSSVAASLPAGMPECRFHFRHRLKAVDELDQRHLGHLHVRLIDDQVGLLVGLLQHVRRCARMVGVLGNEPLSLVVDDDARQQDLRWVRGRGDEQPVEVLAPRRRPRRRAECRARRRGDCPECRARPRRGVWCAASAPMPGCARRPCRRSSRNRPRR